MSSGLGCQNCTKFYEKYVPTDVADIIGDPNITTNIIQWLSNFRKEQYKCMIVIGPHGSGKSCRVNVALKKLNIKARMFSEIKTQLMEHPQRFMSQLASGMDIMSFMNGYGAKQSAIIIDEMDVELLAHEKKNLITLMKINNANGYCPIIFVFDMKHNKLITTLKKSTKEIRIYEPSDMDMMKLLQRIITREKIVMEDCEVSNKIIEFSQHDFRKLCTTVGDLVNDFGSTHCGCVDGSNMITMGMINEYSSIMCEKNISFDLYRSCQMLLTDYKNIDDCMRLYQIEKVNIPLMVQYNYIHKIIQYQDMPITSQKLKYITNALSFGDIVDNYIYGEQRWDLTNVHGLFSCCIPSYHLNAFPKTYTKRPEYSIDMNKTSTKKSNKKHIMNASKIFDSTDPLDYIYIRKILYAMVLNDQMTELIKIMKTYKITLKKLENLLKIDKNSSTKVVLTAKQKKLLKDI
jgi:hypothetical protein